MTRGLGGTAPANVQNYLKGASYPVKKEQLVDIARKNGAPEEIVNLIEELPAEEFGGPQDVMKAYGELSPEERKAS